MSEEKIITFNARDGSANGTIDINDNKTELVCIPSKRHYNEIDIALTEPGCMNLVVGDVDCSWLSWEDRQKVGYEMVNRWNKYIGLQKVKNSIVKGISFILNLRQVSENFHNSENYIGAYKKGNEDCLKALKKAGVIKDYNLTDHSFTLQGEE